MISGVVLAAGRGSRFGGTKQLAQAAGIPLVLYAVDALREAGVGELLVVTGHDAEAVEAVLPDDTSAVRNPDHLNGQASSLAAGLHATSVDSEAAVILLADQPGVTADDVTALIKDFRATHAQIVRIRYTDGPGPALLSREIYGEAGHLHGDTGARILIASHPEWLHEIDVARAAPVDVDVAADLDRL